MNASDIIKGIAFIVSKLPIERWILQKPYVEEHSAPWSISAPVLPTITPQPSEQVSLPTTQETVDELKRRLAKELYRMELDLQGGGRIAGKPCDCLGKKHHLGLEATAEELMSYESNPLYAKVIDWLNRHESEFRLEEVARHPPEHYQALTPEMRRFRKEVMGTESVGAMLSSKEKERVVRRVTEKLEEE